MMTTFYNFVQTESTGFELTWDKKVWYRYLAYKGKRLFQIGNVCETCEFFFEKNDETLYVGAVKTFNVLRGDTKDPYILNYCYSNENGKLTVYSETTPYKPLFIEFIIPLSSSNQCARERVEYYKKQIMERELFPTKKTEPTAVAISTLERKYPMGDKDQWTLVHYLIDGHHKLQAAYELNKPITILSYLKIDEPFCNERELNYLKCILWTSPKNETVLPFPYYEIEEKQKFSFFANLLRFTRRTLKI